MIDRTGSFLWVDLFPGDLNGAPKWDALVAAVVPAHEVVGALLKASDGVSWGTSKENWFAKNWTDLGQAFGDRRGDDLLMGAYHYLEFFDDGATQAQYFCRMLDRVGGLQTVDVMPIVDVERGTEKSKNYKASKAQVEDCTAAYVEKVISLTGRNVMLYGNTCMHDLGITSRMGCSALWTARYLATLPSEVYTKIGWDPQSLVGWQYTDGSGAKLVGYPSSIDGFGACDISVYVSPTNPTTLGDLRARLT